MSIAKLAELFPEQCGPEQIKDLCAELSQLRQLCREQHEALKLCYTYSSVKIESVEYAIEKYTKVMGS